MSVLRNDLQTHVNWKGRENRLAPEDVLSIKKDVLKKMKAVNMFLEITAYAVWESPLKLIMTPHFMSPRRLYVQ